MFHAYVERSSLRSGSAAWEKVTAEGEALAVPTQLESWVAADPNPPAPKPAENVTATAEATTA